MRFFPAFPRLWFVLLLILLIGCEDVSDRVQDDDVDALSEDLSWEDTPWLYHGSWNGEWIEEKAPYSGRSRYYSTGFYYDNGSICGNDNGPNDTVFMFTVPAGVNTSKLRIYSDSSRARCAIPGGLSTRVQQWWTCRSLCWLLASFLLLGESIYLSEQHVSLDRIVRYLGREPFWPICMNCRIS